MIIVKEHHYHNIKNRLSNFVGLLLLLPLVMTAKADVKFSAQMLDLGANEQIDIDRFSRAGFVQPGKYNLAWRVNGQSFSESSFLIQPNPAGIGFSILCLLPEHLDKIPLTIQARKHIKLLGNPECLDWDSLPGTTYQVDINNQIIDISMPKKYLEFSEDNWDPPALWEEGLSGALLDYNLNATHQQNRGSHRDSMDSTGVVGLNFASWRLRGDWQGSLYHNTRSEQAADKNFQWNQVYLYRAIKPLSASLSLGETYFNSDIFDSFRFTGASLYTDTDMLPPSLRDFAPEVTGVARTNAQVEISQNGRILYQTQVPAGPFTINSLPSYLSGIIDVTILEQDGSEQKYQVNANSVPFLTRPGSFRYKLALGKPLKDTHKTINTPFSSGEISWGVSNNWSLYSGFIGSEEYTSLSLGIGRDLFSFGAASFDITHSTANVEQKSSKIGNTYRLNYNKQLANMNIQLQLSAMKYDNNFMSMPDFIDYSAGHVFNAPKGMYSVSINKRFNDQRLSSSLSYSKRTFQHKEDTHRYDFTLSKYFDVVGYKNIAASLSGYESSQSGSKDNGLFFNLSIPWGSYSSINYNATKDNRGINQLMGVFHRVDENTNYRLNLGQSRSNLTGNAFFNHDASNAKFSGSSSFSEGQYVAFGFNVQGGVTMTPQGGAMHRIGIPGNTRVLVDTDDVPGIPIRGYGRSTYSNYFGKAIVPDVRNYYRNKIIVDMNELPDDADVIDTVDTVTLTKGAIGYRQFQVNAGLKRMVFIRLDDSKIPPFGAEVFNSKGQNTGIIGESGATYLSGIKPNETMTIGKGDSQLCKMQIPDDLSSVQDSVLLVCSSQ